MDWFDSVGCVEISMLHFDEINSAYGRHTVTAWLPCNAACPDLYRQIVTQMSFIRKTVNSVNLNIKRSTEAGNAIHISSSVKNDVTACIDLIVELVNFRVKSFEQKLKHKHTSPFVDIFTVNNYNGNNIIGERNEGKNFIVSFSEIFGIRTLVTYINAKTIRIALLGKVDAISKARKSFEEFIADIAATGDEIVSQKNCLAKAADSFETPPAAPPSPPPPPPAVLVPKFDVNVFNHVFAQNFSLILPYAIAQAQAYAMAAACA